jgi:hypothetical protein
LEKRLGHGLRGGTARLTVYNLVTDRMSLEYKQPFSSGLGWEWNFVPKKFRGIDEERFLLFLGNRSSFPGSQRTTKEFIPELGTEQYYAKKVSFTKKLVFLFHGWANSGLFSLPLNSSEWNSESLHLFLFQGKEF